MFSPIRLLPLVAISTLSGCQHSSKPLNLEDLCGTPIAVTADAPAQKLFACTSVLAPNGGIFASTARLPTTGEEIKQAGALAGTPKADIHVIMSANGASGQVVMTITPSTPPGTNGGQAAAEAQQTVITITAVPDGKPVRATVDGYKATLRLSPIKGQ